jgi:hypothetical protein
MPYSPINLSEKFGRFGERWAPRIVAQMNDYHFKLVKIQGEFIWQQTVRDQGVPDDADRAGRHPQHG